MVGFGLIAYKLYDLHVQIKQKTAHIHTLIGQCAKKDDKAFAVLAGAMQDALAKGEGLFLIRKIHDGTYLWKVDDRDVHFIQKDLHG